jgi:hypothetical protein
MLARRLLLAHDPLGRHDQLPAPRDDRHLVRQEAGAREAAAVVARRVLEHRGIGMAHSGRTLTRDPTLVEQAEQAAAGECALQSTRERGRERLAHRRAGQVGEDAVGETVELQLAGVDESDQRVLGAIERSRERALGGGGRIVALGHVVLQESGGAVGPRLA